MSMGVEPIDDTVLSILLENKKTQPAVEIYYAKQGEPYGRRKITPLRIYKLPNHRAHYYRGVLS
jgi:hypothetical protein